MANEYLKILTIVLDGLGSSNNMVDLSIIIPSYNTRQLLMACLSSIYKSTKTPFEIIIVDNASTDGTVQEIEQKYKDIKLIKNKMNLGFARAVNQGLKEAKGQYPLILNSDTEILDEAIDKEIDFLRIHNDVGAVGCQLKNPDKSIQASGGYLPNLFNVFLWMTFLDDFPIFKKIFPSFHVQDKNFYKREHKLGWVTGAFLLTKKEVLEKVGFFDEEMFMYVEEVDWCQRVNKAGLKVVFDPTASIIHYKSASTRRGKAGILEEYQGLKYFFSKTKASWQMSILKVLLKLGAFLRILVFGIILKDLESRRIYAKAFDLA